jgi:hypothetical protein
MEMHHLQEGLKDDLTSAFAKEVEGVSSRAGSGGRYELVVLKLS